MNNPLVPAPVESTYCFDPEACYIVSSIGQECRGIQGYFKSEFEAHRVARHYKKMGHTNVSVDPYDPYDRTSTGMNDLVVSGLLGY